MPLKSHQPQGTHLPLLMAAIAQSDGPVLELGCGDTSTPMLHALLDRSGRRLWSFDNDLTYVDRFAFLRREWHEINRVDWPDFRPQDRYGVILIDHAPAGQRVPDIIRLQNSADFLICHDAEDAAYGYAVAYQHFRYRQVDRTFEPWTVCLSNVKRLLADWVEDLDANGAK